MRRCDEGGSDVHYLSYTCAASDLDFLWPRRYPTPATLHLSSLGFRIARLS